MKKQTSTDLRRALREQRAAYEELLGLSGAILAALCVRCGDGATLRLPKQAVHDALETYEFAAAADPAIWDASRGDSIADIADRYGVYFEPGDHKRLPGWMQVHYRLAFDQAGLPMLYVFRNCRDTRRTLPLLRYDAHAPEDVDTRQEDHIADEIRYLCQSDPIAPRPVVQRTPKVFDPLSSD